MSTAPDPKRAPDTGPVPAPASDAAGGAPTPACPPLAAGLVFDDPLDGPSADDADHGWGESFSGAADDFTRFLNEKPPHHL